MRAPEDRQGRKIHRAPREARMGCCGLNAEQINAELVRFLAYHTHRLRRNGTPNVQGEIPTNRPSKDVARLDAVRSWNQPHDACALDVAGTWSRLREPSDSILQRRNTD